jgi:hypothetical protein
MHEFSLSFHQFLLKLPHHGMRPNSPRHATSSTTASAISNCQSATVSARVSEEIVPLWRKIIDRVLDQCAGLLVVKSDVVANIAWQILEHDIRGSTAKEIDT